jgi:hypothetical protein
LTEQKEPDDIGDFMISGTPQLAAGIGEKKKATKRNCKICLVKGTEEEAENICEECFNLVLCKDCTLVHGRNNTTMNHVVTLIPTPEHEDVVSCEAHGEPVRSYCRNCSMPVCPVCVLLEHEDHKIVSIGEVCRARFVEVKTAVEEEEKRLEMLQADMKVLTESKATAVEMEDALIQGIEDHAEACIEMILKGKNALKKQVKKEFKVNDVLTKQLEIMLALLHESDETICNAKILLSEARLRPSYLEKLNQCKMKEQLDEMKVGIPAYVRDRESYGKGFAELRKKAMTFYPKTPNMNIGGFDKPDPKKLKEVCNKKGFCVCETCGRLPKPNLNRSGECNNRRCCVCETCGGHISRSNPNRSGECESRGCCVCCVCGQSIPNHRYAERVKKDMH